MLTILIAKKPVYSHHKVRTSLKDRTLDSMFPVANPSQINQEKGKGKAREDAIDVDNAPKNVLSGGASQPHKPQGEIKESQCFLTSVKTLRDAIGKGKHKSMISVIFLRFDA